MFVTTLIGMQKALLKTKTFPLFIAVTSTQTEYLILSYTSILTTTQEVNRRYSQTKQIEEGAFVQSHKINIK